MQIITHLIENELFVLTLSLTSKYKILHFKKQLGNILDDIYLERDNINTYTV